MKPFLDVDDPLAYAHVLSFVVEHPWNMTPAMISVVAEILARRVAGERVDRDEILAAMASRPDLPQPRHGNVAVIPVHGVLAPRMNVFSEMSGGTSYQQLTQDIRKAVADPGIASIVLDVDSPGGSVAGNAELASEIMRARTKKPIIAQAEYTMASAAYHLAAAATEIVASPSARIGSIGTYSIHDDLSAALAHRGIKRTFITAGEGKVDGNETGPLSEVAQARLQKAVNEAYGSFVRNVAHGRGGAVTEDRIRHEWKAHVYGAEEAAALGMVDRVATLDETLNQLLGTAPTFSDGRAARTSTQDVPQTANGGSGQVRCVDAQVERDRFALLLL